THTHTHFPTPHLPPLRRRRGPVQERAAVPRCAVPCHPLVRTPLTHLPIICTRLLACTHTHTHTHTYTNTHTHTPTHTHRHTHTLSISHTHTCTQTLSLTNTHTHTHTHTLSFSLTHILHILYFDISQ